MTIRGAINRWRRRRGKGTRLFEITDRQIRYTGLDKTDLKLYGHYLIAYFPYHFVFGKNNPDYRDQIVKAWLYGNCQGDFDFWFDPFFGEGGVMLSDQNDAFGFRMVFSDIYRIPELSSFTMEASYDELARHGLA